MSWPTDTSRDMQGRYGWFRLAEWLANSLPATSAYRLAEWLADCQWRCSGRDRSAVAANLSLVLGTPVAEHAPMVREVFRNFGRYLVEFFTFHRTLAPSLTVEGSRHLTDARREGRGAIILTAHLGNWEVGAGILHRLGFTVSAIALPHGDQRLDRLFNRQRARWGVRVIHLGPDAAHHGLQCLRSGHLLGMLCDRTFTTPLRRDAAVSTNSVPATLCGRTVRLPNGPALLSVRSRVPAVPTFLIREDRWTFRLCIEPPIWPEMEEASAASLQALTQRYAMVIERYLKRFPSQWLMFQPVTTSDEPARSS